MTTQDKDLAARLAFIAASHDEIQTGETVEKAAAEMELRYHLHAAYRSNQLITTAEADARVEAAVLAERGAAVILVYEIIHESRHVTLGDKLVAAIRARGVTG